MAAVVLGLWGSAAAADVCDYPPGKCEKAVCVPKALRKVRRGGHLQDHLCYRLGHPNYWTRPVRLYRVREDKPDVPHPAFYEKYDRVFSKEYYRSWLAPAGEESKPVDTSSFAPWPFPDDNLDAESGWYRLFIGPARYHNEPLRSPRFSPASKTFKLIVANKLQTAEAPPREAVGGPEYGDTLALGRRASVFVESSEGLRSGRGAIINANGMVVTAARVVLPPSSLSSPSAKAVRVTIDQDALQNRSGDAATRTYDYRPLGRPFPEGFDFEHQLVLLEPTEKIDFTYRLDVPYWFDIAPVERRPDRGCGPLQVTPAQLKKGELAFEILGRGTGQRRFLTSSKRSPASRHYEAVETEDCSPREQLEYHCDGCAASLGWSGSPVIDYRGALWGIHLDKNRGQWAFTVLIAYERAMADRAGRRLDNLATREVSRR